APIKAHADYEKVKLLLDDFLNKRIRKTLNVSDYAQYGLDEPTITIELWKDRSSEPKTFFIGKRGVNFAVYIKEKSEKHIFLIESSALDDLSKSPSDLRDKAIITFNPDAITEIKFEKPEQIHCKREGDRWIMTHPLAVNADTQKIQYILSELSQSQVLSFESDGEDEAPLLEKYGLKNPRIGFSLSDDKSTYGLKIGSDDQSAQNYEGTYKKVYAQSIHQGSIFTVSDRIVQVLNRSVFDLRDKRILDFQRTDTTKFEIQYGTQKIEGVKLDQDRWQLNTPNRLKADPMAVSDLLFGVDSLQAVAFVSDPTHPLKGFGLEPPRIQVSFTVQGENEPAVLRIGKDVNDDTVYVKAENSQQVAMVKRDLIDKILKGVAWLRNKRIFDFRIEDPTRLTVKYNDEHDSDKSLTFTCQRLGSDWRLTAPVKEDANNAAVNEILYEMIDLNADEFISGTWMHSKNRLTDDNTGLNSPILQITVELKSKKLHSVQIGKVDSLGRYHARLNKEPNQVFMINPEVIPRIKAQLDWLRTTEN
ncbi:DUF4340 domain-containing protein, partial [Candidatus Poribacteria bacterium]|nr:DUF4340 domain-containing protein [Candidatus Poribacteria bacterium]